MEAVSSLHYLNQNCTSSDRILLINPPVIESRYQWVRWNQPLDLLKLSNLLKTEIGCEVKLYDFMVPLDGKVTRIANKPDHVVIANGHSFNLWRYGKSEGEFSTWLEETSWRPTQVWITSLTSYWWKGVSNTITRLRNRFLDLRIVLYGSYPRLERSHALSHSFADVLITDQFDLCDYKADFELYDKIKPGFCSLDIRSRHWQQEAVEKLEAGCNNFVFFNDPLIIEPLRFIESVKSFLELRQRIRSKLQPKFYGLCGLYPKDFTAEVAAAMRDAPFVELHFEYETEAGALNRDSYKRVKKSLEDANFKLPPDQLSGFIYVGLPNDELDQIIKHALNLFEVFGSVILKPWSPTPGDELYQRYEKEMETERIELLSPHLFPFSQISGITPSDYEELYVLIAALNQKVRSRAFDTFPGSLAYEMISRSLSKEVWKLTA